MSSITPRSRVHIAQRGSITAVPPAMGIASWGLPPPPAGMVTKSVRAAASPAHNVDLAVYEAVCDQAATPLYYVDSRTGETRWELPIGASASEALGGEALLARSAAAAAVEAEAKCGWVKRAASPMVDARAMRTLTLAATPSGAESASEVGALKEIHAKELAAQDALMASWSAEFKANMAARATAESELLASESARRKGEVEVENLRALLRVVTMVPLAHEADLLPPQTRQAPKQQQQRAPTPARSESDAEYKTFIDAIYSGQPAAPREPLRPRIVGGTDGEGGGDVPADALDALHAKRKLFHRIRAKVRSGAHSVSSGGGALSPSGGAQPGGMTIEAMMQQQHNHSKEAAAEARALSGSAEVVADQRDAHSTMARTWLGRGDGVNSNIPLGSPTSSDFRHDAIPPPPPPLDIYAPAPGAASRRAASAARSAKTRESLLAVRINVLGAIVRNEAQSKLWRDAVMSRLFPVAARVPGGRDPPLFASTCEREYLRRILRIAVGSAPDGDSDVGITRAELQRALSATPFDEGAFRISASRYRAYERLLR